MKTPMAMKPSEPDPRSGSKEAFCSGYIYSANCGWISLGNGSPADGQAYSNTSATDFGVNHDGLGNLSGYAYGANIGWINFEQTRDGIPAAWEYGHTNTLLALPNGDSDGDGVPDLGEYAADTNPFDSGDYLAITDFQALGTTNWVTWPVKTTRVYTLQQAAALSNGMSWAATSSPFIPPSGPEMSPKRFPAQPPPTASTRSKPTRR